MNSRVPVLLSTVALLLAACSGDTGGSLPPDASADNSPEACVPDCFQKQCGDDGCGGSCGQCGGGKVCNPVLHKCLGGCEANCVGKVCGSDGCGGSCGDCDLDQDCMSGQCVAKANCDDGQKNGSESDVDCGGLCPDKCVVGKACKSPADCTTGICTNDVCEPDLSCKDGQKNHDETDVDCGGPKCTPCALTKFCVEHKDCLSEACIWGVCEKPTCTDNAKNQGEGDVDCGGPCPEKCVDGQTCKAPEDCVSHFCGNGVCASCEDGKKNGSETDVDCGGPCKKCAEGKHCEKGSDCTGGGCEGGTCCVKNACGKCATLPPETCNGLDDDCDGTTDNHLTGGPADCPLQKGVCKGAKQQCRGNQGWVCDDATYKAFNAKYEATETSCDNVDNDCDGDADEGLKNKCGKCGPLPKEVCNGLDDDCNGTKDDAPACQKCQAVPSPVDLVSVDSGWGFQMSWRNFMAMIGDEAFIFVYNRGSSYYATPFFRLADGALVSTKYLSISVVGNPYLWPGNGFLHLAVTGYNSGSIQTQHQYYYQVGADGQVLKQTEIDDSTNFSGAPSPVAQGGSTVGLVYWPSSGGPIYTTMQSDGTWAYQGSVTGSGDYGLQLAIRKDGTAFVGTKSGSFEGPVYVQEVGGTSYTVDSGKCNSPALRVAPDDTVWVVYESGASTDYDGTVKAWTLKGSSASTPETIDAGSSPNIAFDAAGKPVVAYVVGGKDLEVASRGGTTWTQQHVYSTATGETLGAYVAIGVDSMNRYHVGFASYTPGTYGSLVHIKYVMFCPQSGGTCTPDCTGKACGDDGCGGSCGTCGSGQSCSAAGQCTGGSGCGADPANTCAGACGSQGSGDCWCNSWCVDYGDCCPDYAACCG